ncbi:MAG: TIGR01777 family oxidoreductase [Cyclobacteriaceae bacterium]|nr:TIGR01777 family oxidoreductase [Cyclobacteriaceae bacterium]
MSKNVLITGASGLVGSRLTSILQERGYQVSSLSRSKKSKNAVKSYTWDISQRFIEEGALENTNIVVHLAGAGVADKRWSKSRKREILTSRKESTALLYQELKSKGQHCHTFVSASAIGYYGWDTKDQWVDEQSAMGAGFLAEVTGEWEEKISKLAELNLRVVTLRIGVVLSVLGGALPKIAQSVKLNAGAPLGNGRQYMSWIHMDDLCEMFVKAIEDPRMTGVYNAVAPHPVTNREFTVALARTLKKPLFLPPVPAWTLRLMLGEMAQLVLGGNRVSSEKIVSHGYNFKFAEVEPALRSLLN